MDNPSEGRAGAMSKKTNKRKTRRRRKANHGHRPA
jgi:hypothetical protein